MKSFFRLVTASLFCVACLNTPLSMAGYANFALPTELTYTLISSLQRGKTTEQDVKMLLGMPMTIDAHSTQSEWFYKTEKARLLVKFNNDHILNAYEYIGSDGGNPSSVDARQVQSLTVGTTDTDLIRSLGEPTYVAMSPTGKEFYYRSAQPSTTLRVVLDEKAGLVKNYLFLEKGEPTASISSENLLRVEKGKTTPTDVKTLFGTPTQRTIEKDKETWYYQSANAQLIVTFSKGDSQTVSAYQYLQK